MSVVNKTSPQQKNQLYQMIHRDFDAFKGKAPSSFEPRLVVDDCRRILS
jgi:hypothetical protein